MKPSVIPPIKLTPFMNLKSDFGFKYVFGLDKNKSVIINTLDILFKGRLKIENITYRDKEMLPSKPGGKRILYDIYFTANGTSMHFILEMQLYNHEFIGERILKYSIRPLVDQGTKGDLSYKLAPVYSIVFTSFNMPGLQHRLINRIALCETTTMELYSDKLNIILISLAMLPKKWENCNTKLERLLYLIKNMEKMDKNCKEYNDGEFKYLFDAAATDMMCAEDVVAYSQSLQRLNDIDLEIKYAKDKSFEEGTSKGLARGRAEGRAEERDKMARSLLAEKDLDLGFISKITGLDIDYLIRLKDEPRK